MFIQFLKRKDGNIAISAALCFGVLSLSVGCALDFMNASAVKLRMQDTADAAALAAARGTDVTSETAEADARKFIQANLDETLASNIQVAVTAENLSDGSTVSVKLGGEAPTSFLRIANIESISVSAFAVAKKTKNPMCIYALDPKSTGTFKVSGSGTVSAPNCGIQVNSDASKALIVNGGGALEAKTIRVSGRFDTKGHYSPTPLTEQEVLADPLATLPDPEMPAGCNYNNHTFSAPAILPANRVYCGTMTFMAGVTLQPGIHFFKDAEVKIASGARLLGAGVMLYFGPDSSLDQAVGHGGITITPMVSGLYKGISIFASRESSGHPLFRFLGNESLSLSGTIYIPKASLEMTGSSDLSVPSLLGGLIAWNFLFTGNASLRFENAGLVPDALQGSGVILVK